MNEDELKKKMKFAFSLPQDATRWSWRQKAKFTRLFHLHGAWKVSRTLIMLNEGGYYATFTWWKRNICRLWISGWEVFNFDLTERKL